MIGRYLYQLVFCGWSCLFPLLGIAEISIAPDTLILSLESSIERALKYNLQIQQSALAIKSEQISWIQAKTNLLPSVGAVGRFNYNVGRSVNPITNDFTDQPVRSQDYGISADLLLYDGGRNIRAIRNQKGAVLAARYDLSATERETILAVMQAYLEVLLRRELWEEAYRRIQKTDEEIQRTQLLVDAGEVSPVNLTQLRAQRAENQLTVVRNQNDWQQAQLVLRQITFVASNQLIDVVNPDLNAEILPPTQSLSIIYQQAQRLDPALKRAVVHQELAESNIKIAKGAYLPTVNLSVGGYSSYSDSPPPYLESYTYTRQLDFNLRKYLSLELSVPIYSQGQVKARVQQAKVDHRRVDIALMEEQQRLWEALEIAYWNTKTSWEEYQAAQDRENAVRKAFKAAEVQFELGVIDVISYTQTERQLSEAVAARVQSKYQLIFYQKILDFYQQPSLGQ